MLNRKQVACEDGRKDIEDVWAKLQVMEKNLAGHDVSGKLIELGFSGVHAALTLLAEMLKHEIERHDDDELR